MDKHLGNGRVWSFLSEYLASGTSNPRIKKGGWIFAGALIFAAPGVVQADDSGALSQVGSLVAPKPDLVDYFGRQLVDEKARAGSEGQGRFDLSHGPLTFYGKLYPQIDFISGSDATAEGPSALATLAAAPTGLNLEDHQELTSSNSRFGFRGALKLGDGLKAIYQAETVVSIGGSSSLFGSERDTFVGLSSRRFGTIKFGDLDTVYKNLGSDEAIGFNQVASGNFVSTNNIAAKAPYGSSASSFNQRKQNSLYYYSPSIYGLHLLGQYSPDSAKTQKLNAEFWSVGARYIKGGFSVAVAQEVHMDAFGGDPANSALSNIGSGQPKSAPSVTSRDEGNRLTLVYHTDKTAVWGEVAKLEYHDFGGANGHFEHFERVSYTIGAERQFTDTLRAIATYSHAENGSCALVGGVACSTAGLNGSQWNAGLTYYLYRRMVSVYGLYSLLDNGPSAAYSNVPSSTDVFGVGERVQQVALGVMVSFAR